MFFEKTNIAWLTLGTKFRQTERFLLAIQDQGEPIGKCLNISLKTLQWRVLDDSMTAKGKDQFSTYDATTEYK